MDKNKIMEYFSIGSLVAVMAFTLAFFQLLNQLILFRLSLKWPSLRCIIIVYTLSIIFILFAAIILYYPINIKNMLLIFDASLL